MTPDLSYLTWSALLCILMWLPHISVRALIIGLPAAMGYPSEVPELPKWIARAARSHTNMVENLAPFAVLVLVAHVGGLANESTALGAALFFWAKLGHVIVHILGIPYIRTGAFLVSWVGMVLIAWQIVGPQLGG